MNNSVFLFISFLALIALFLNIHWLFLSMLFLFAALAAGRALSPQAKIEKTEKKIEKKPVEYKVTFLDNLLSSLIADKHKAALEKRKKDGEKTEKK